MAKINIFSKLFFEIKLLWLDYCFYLRYTPEEREHICAEELAELKTMLRKEEHHVDPHNSKYH